MAKNATLWVLAKSDRHSLWGFYQIWVLSTSGMISEWFLLLGRKNTEMTCSHDSVKLGHPTPPGQAVKSSALNDCNSTILLAMMQCKLSQCGIDRINTTFINDEESKHNISLNTAIIYLAPSGLLLQRSKCF